MFSELDNALLPWLPYIAGILLGAWMSYEFRQAEVDPRWGEETEDWPKQGRAAGEQPQHPLKAPKAVKKGGVAGLITEEYQKRS
jgi:hypothetical protein